MDLLKLFLLFAVIIVVLWMKRPLWQAIIAGLAVMAGVYQISPINWPGLVSNVFTDWGSFSILASVYLITYLQRMLEARSQIKLAQDDLNGLFHNRRITAAGASLFIGLLPSAAAMILCGDLVKKATEGYLKPKEQAFVASWFRHIPESTLPTYAGVLLMANISGVPLGQFILGMIIPNIVLGVIGYYPYLHQVPKNPGNERSENKSKDLLNLFKHLWSLLLILALILALKLDVVPAVIIVIALAAIVYRFRTQELAPMIRSAFDTKLLLNTFLVLTLKEFIVFSGMLTTLPDTLSLLPIPEYLIFSILFFIGGIVSGSNGIIAMAAPLAFATVQGGMPFMVLLMGICHVASQLSPTHVCLVVAADYFKITLGELIRKTIPAALIFIVFILGYYHMLIALGFK